MNSCNELEVIEHFYNAVAAKQLYTRLLNEQNWPDNRYKVAGRELTLPRLQTWHADPGVRYSYSNNLLETRAWTPLLLDIRNKVERRLDFPFNSVLVNLYRDGNDYVGWHSDNEAELGDQPFIASLTLGATRQFAFRHKRSGQEDAMFLESGALLIMQPGFQHHWLHSIPTDIHQLQGRINLTFRRVTTPNLEA